MPTTTTRGPQTRPIAPVLPLPTVDTAPAAPTSRRAARELERARDTAAASNRQRLLDAAARAGEIAATETATGLMAVAHERRHEETAERYLDRLAEQLRRAGYEVHPLDIACVPAPGRRTAPKCRRGSVGHQLLRVVVNLADALGGMTNDAACEAADQPTVLGNWRRFGELAHAGLIEATGEHRLSSRGRPQALYVATQAGREHLAGLELPAPAARG